MPHLASAEQLDLTVEESVFAACPDSDIEGWSDGTVDAEL
jgi:hypothetical protein